MTDGTAPTSGFAPLRQKVFAVLWVATIVGNTGSFIRDVASSWLVPTCRLRPPPSRWCRPPRRFRSSCWRFQQAAVGYPRPPQVPDRHPVPACGRSVGLMLLSTIGLQSVSSLIALTFVGGIGAALMAPTWQAIVPELVLKQDVKSAVALNSLGINISRAIGPAVGGLLLAYFGAAVTYGVDVISYVFVIAALIWWRRAATPDDALSEHFFGAFRAGLRYAKASRELHVVLLRATVFFAFASAVWALLPLVARNLLGGNAGFYGILLGAVGAGAIGGALIMPRLRARFDADALLLGAALVTAAVMAILSLAPPQWAAIVALLALGAAWITALTTLNGAAQAILPNWVRGRSLAIYLTVFNGAMTAGSLAWGAVAEATGIPLTLVIVLLVLPRSDFSSTSSSCRRATQTSSRPTIAGAAHGPACGSRSRPRPRPHRYNVDKTEHPDFLKALAKLSNERRRDGAYGWGVTEDAADPERIVEWFMVESWAEHLRQHRRVSKADADVQQEVRRFHKGAEAPVVSHLLSINRPQET